MILPARSFGIMATVPHVNKVNDEANYFTEIAFLAGAVINGETKVSSPFGNKMSTVPEWTRAGFTEKESEDYSVYISKYSDVREFEGHSSIGIEVEQSIYGIGNNYSILNYTVKSVKENLKGVYVGISFMITPPDNNDKGGWDKEVSVISGNLISSYNMDSGIEFSRTAGIVPLTGEKVNINYYKAGGLPADDAGIYDLLIGKNVIKTLVESGSAYIMSIGPFNLKKGEIKKFTAAVVENAGISNLSETAADASNFYTSKLGGAVLSKPLISTVVTPDDFELYQNYPNPFNIETGIKFSLKESGETTLKIFDIAGREIKTLVNKTLDKGLYTANWDGRNNAGDVVSSGVYLYMLKSGYFKTVKRMVLLK
ncbi:FlgD immunoglobulin-like domain containing protein [candidate division KSB1 bacterium]